MAGIEGKTSIAESSAEISLPNKSGSKYMIVEEMTETLEFGQEVAAHTQDEDLSESYDEAAPVVVTCGMLILRTRGGSVKDKNLKDRRKLLSKRMEMEKIKKDILPETVESENNDSCEIKRGKALDMDKLDSGSVSGNSSEDFSKKLVSLSSSGILKGKIKKTRSVEKCEDLRKNVENLLKESPEILKKMKSKSVSVTGSRNDTSFNPQEVTIVTKSSDLKPNSLEKGLTNMEEKISGKSVSEERSNNEAEKESEKQSTLNENISSLATDQYPDFSQSVMRFQDAIQTFAKDILEDTFDSMGTGEYIFTDQTAEKEASPSSHSTLQCNTDNIKDASEANVTFDNLHGAVDEHSNKCKVSILGNIELPEIPVTQLSQLMDNKINPSVIDSKVDPENKDIPTICIIDNESENIQVGTKEKSKSPNKNDSISANSKGLLNTEDDDWVHIPMLRSHSDSEALQQKYSGISIQELDVTDYMDNSDGEAPIIEEVDENPDARAKVKRKSVGNKQSIEFEELSMSESYNESLDFSKDFCVEPTHKDLIAFEKFSEELVHSTIQSVTQDELMLKIKSDNSQKEISTPAIHITSDELSPVNFISVLQEEQNIVITWGDIVETKDTDFLPEKLPIVEEKTVEIISKISEGYEPNDCKSLESTLDTYSVETNVDNKMENIVEMNIVKSEQNNVETSTECLLQNMMLTEGYERDKHTMVISDGTGNVKKDNNEAEKRDCKQSERESAEEKSEMEPIIMESPSLSDIGQNKMENAAKLEYELNITRNINEIESSQMNEENADTKYIQEHLASEVTEENLEVRTGEILAVKDNLKLGNIPINESEYYDVMLREGNEDNVIAKESIEDERSNGLNIAVGRDENSESVIKLSNTTSSKTIEGGLKYQEDIIFELEPPETIDSVLTLEVVEENKDMFKLDEMAITEQNELVQKNISVERHDNSVIKTERLYKTINEDENSTKSIYFTDNNIFGEQSAESETHNMNNLIAGKEDNIDLRLNVDEMCNENNVKAAELETSSVDNIDDDIGNNSAPEEVNQQRLMDSCGAICNNLDRSADSHIDDIEKEHLIATQPDIVNRDGGSILKFIESKPSNIAVQKSEEIHVDYLNPILTFLACLLILCYLVVPLLYGLLDLLSGGSQPPDGESCALRDGGESSSCALDGYVKLSHMP